MDSGRRNPRARRPGSRSDRRPGERSGARGPEVPVRDRAKQEGGNFSTNYGEGNRPSDRRGGGHSPRSGQNRNTDGGRGPRFSGIGDFINDVGPGRLLFMVFIAAAVTFFVIFAIKYGPGMMDALATGVERIANAFLYLLIVSLIVWVILLFAIGKYLPGKLKGVLLLVVFILTLLCQFYPGLGETLLVLVVLLSIFSSILH